MAKLHPQSQLRPTTESIAIILAHYGLPPLPYRAAQSGIENLTLLVGDAAWCYVLRVYRQDKKSDADIRRELDFMEALRRGGLPLPTLRRTTQGETLLTLRLTGQPWQCLLMDHAPGRHPTRYTSALLANMAQHQAHMHLLGREYAQRENLPASYATLHAHVVAGEDTHLPAEWQTAEAQAFLARLQRFEVALEADLPCGMSHFDYDADNLFADKSGRVTAILDFDDAQCRPLVVCLGYTLWDVWMAGESAEISTRNTDKYLRHYQETRPLTPRELAVLPRVMLHRHYQVVASDLMLGELRQDAMETVLRQEAQLQTLGS